MFKRHLCHSSFWDSPSLQEEIWSGLDGSHASRDASQETRATERESSSLDPSYIHGVCVVLLMVDVFRADHLGLDKSRGSSLKKTDSLSLSSQ